MPTYADRLNAIADELETLAAGLNTHSTECGSCGSHRFDAYEEELAARKLLGYADSLRGLRDTRTGRKKDGPLAAFLSREAPTDRANAKWDALWARLDAGDDMLAVAEDVEGLILNNEHTAPRAARVLARINPWLREQGIAPGRRTLQDVRRSRSTSPAPPSRE
jgi:hypothetical protein